MTTARAISPTPTRSEDPFLSGDCQLYFSAGSLKECNARLQAHIDQTTRLGHCGIVPSKGSRSKAKRRDFQTRTAKLFLFHQAAPLFS